MKRTLTHKCYLFLLYLTYASESAHILAEDRPKYEYRSSEISKVHYRLPDGDGVSITAYLSDNGEFVRDPLSPAGASSLYRTAVNDSRDKKNDFGTIGTEYNEQVYEFRSGSLILGKLVYPGRFVPSIGGKVTSIDDFIPDPDLPRIYNLPGIMVKVPVGLRQQRFAASPAWQPFVVTGPIKYPDITHHLTLDVERKVGVMRGGSVFIGRLNKLGQFTENRKIDPVSYQKQKSLSIQNSEGIMEIIPVINHPIIVPIPNTTPVGELVYEYRSGKLTCGKLNFDGVFEPTAGTIVIDFGTFRYTKEEWRIYNLPGTFTPILKR